MLGSIGAPSAPRRGTHLLGWLAAAGAAAAAGLLYGWSAYSLDPLVLPLLLLASAAVALGAWRLEWGVALLLVLTPFAENAELSDPASAKLRILLIAWAALLVAIEAARLAVREERVPAPPLARAASGFTLAAMVGVAVASDAGAAVGKLLTLLGSILLFAAVALSLRDWRRLEIVLAGALTAGLLVSAHAIYQNITGDLSRIGFVDGSGAVEYRVTSTFTHPNQLAGFLVVLVPVAIALAPRFTRRWLRVLAVVVVPLALTAIILSYSRGALVGLLALSMLAVRSPRLWPLLVAGLVAIALLAPGVWRDRVANAGSLDSPEIASRIDIWGAALDGFEQRPVLGWGLNNFREVYVSLERPGRSYLGSGAFDVPDAAHNLYLNTLAEQGLVGIAALIALGIGILRMTGGLRGSPDRRIRALGWGLLGTTIVVAAHNVFDVTFVDPKTSVLVWTLLGVGAAAARIETRP